MEIQVEDLPQQSEARSPAAPISTSPVDHLMISSQFNVENPSKEESDKLITIWEHAKELSKTGTHQDIIWQVINLRSSLGAPSLGESSLNKVYRWAKLKAQEKMIQEQLRNV